MDSENELSNLEDRLNNAYIVLCNNFKLSPYLRDNNSQISGKLLPEKNSATLKTHEMISISHYMKSWSLLPSQVPQYWSYNQTNIKTKCSLYFDLMVRVDESLKSCNEKFISYTKKTWNTQISKCGIQGQERKGGGKNCEDVRVVIRTETDSRAICILSVSFFVYSQPEPCNRPFEHYLRDIGKPVRTVLALFILRRKPA